MILKSDVACHCGQYLYAEQRKSIYIDQRHEQYSKCEWTKLLHTLSVTRQLMGLINSKVKTFKQSVPVLHLNNN
jgi:hypothetical protein